MFARTAVDPVQTRAREVLSFVPPLRHVHEAFDRSVALVMGINAYRNGVPRLGTAVADAHAVGELLEVEHGFTTLLRCDDEVTVERVRMLLGRKFRDDLGSELTAHDRLLVYFAGHGLSLPSEHGPEGHLLLADAEAVDPSTFFAMSELRRLVSALTCRHVLLVLDCCFAGTFRWAGQHADRGAGGPAYRETLDRFVKHRAWQVLVSTNHDQTALDAVSPGQGSGPLFPQSVHALGPARIETGRHSPFAAALLQALRGAADFTRDGLITATELELFVRDAVENATSVHQTPQLYKLEQHDRGQFVFQVPSTTLDLRAAPALSLAACPYQGLQPYTSSDRDRFFGRSRVVAALVDRVHANPLTVVLGPSGAGKSSLLAAGLVPALRETGWTVIEARPDATPADTLRDMIEVPTQSGMDPGQTLLERITAWLSVHVSDRLCLAIDQAEGFEVLALAEARSSVLGDLAQALDAHGARLRVVLTLRSEFEPVFRDSALAPLWKDSAFVIPALAHHELREIIERPAGEFELSFEPPSLVDTLIDEVLQAPGALPLLSFALRELYVRCAQRNHDRLLTEGDYAQMGRLSGALAQRASALLQELVARDAAYTATARRVFLRMVVGRDDDWVRRRAHRDELVYADPAENQRVAALLTAFRDARLVVFDKDAWEPAHDWLVRGWPTLSMWRVQFGAKALTMQFDLAEAVRRWSVSRRAAYLWNDDPRLPEALRTLRAPESWLNARERAFVAASAGRRRFWIYAALSTLVFVAIAVTVIWDFFYRTHVSYYRHHVRRWGEPDGIDPLTESEGQGRQSSVKLVRKGRLGHVFHVELLRNNENLIRINQTGISILPELGIGREDKHERVPCQWDFVYESNADTVSTETARDCSGRFVYRLQYRGGSRDRRKAGLIDESGDDAPINRGDAERIEFVRSTLGLDIEKHYTLRHGEPARNQDGISVEIQAYDERGHVVHTRYLDEAGKPTRSKDGSAGWRATFDLRGNETERTFLDEAGNPARRTGGIAGWRSTFDRRGNETERTFLDETGKPTRHRDGNAGYRSTFDPRGNLTACTFVDEAGNPTRLDDGKAGWRSTFDPRGKETERVFLDEAGSPTRTKYGNAGWRSTFDTGGNETETTFLDEFGKPTHGKGGSAGRRSTFDLRGYETERVILDEAGNPVWAEFGFAGWRATLDQRGYKTRVAFLDEAGNPARTVFGFAVWRFAYDLRGNETESMYLDEAGAPMRSNLGNAGWRSTFDSRGHETQRVYLDEAGKPTWHIHGHAGWRSTFDPYGNESEHTFLDEAGKPTLGKDGYAGWRLTFDPRGNETERVYLDEPGKPTWHKDGYTGYRSTYDAHGNKTQRMYLDEAGNATWTNDGVAGYRSRFDARDHETERAFFDEAGKPARRKDGIAGYRMTFDPRGNQTEVAYFDEAGKPTRNNEGVAGFHATFDRLGYETERAFFNEAGKPTRNKDGVAGHRATFDRLGKETERMFFNEAGKPTRNKDGIAGRRSTFDRLGKETERTFLNEAGKPKRNTDGVAGYRSTFNRLGKETARMFFNEVGKPIRNTDGIAGYRSTFDRLGNETERTFFNEAGKPIRNKDGIAGYRSTFDPRGNRTTLVYLDEAGKPIRNKDGIAGYRSTFDQRGNGIESVAFDEAGKPARRKDGITGWRSTFDPRGQEIEQVYFDEAGKPVRDNEGVAGWRSTFDPRGHKIEHVYLDEAGKPVRGKDGYASRRSTFDARGNEIKLAFFDRTGKATRDNNGVAEYRSTFDSYGNEVEEAFFDETGRPVRIKEEEYALYRATFDPYGNEIDVAFFDETGKRTRNKNGYAIYRTTFDPLGNMTEEAFFDETGRPARSKADGYARYHATFDQSGKEMTRAYFDEAGKPVQIKAPSEGVRKEQ